MCVDVTGRHHQFSSASEAIEDRKSDTPHAPPEVARVGLTADGGMYRLRVGVTMSIHKLTAGSGYDYLTRQVAALDATEKGHTGLASYYTERGETPGVWIGSGLDGIDGLTAGDPVTAEQMRALFGCGLHPLAEQRQQQLEGPDLTDTGLSGGDPAGGAVQDLRRRRQPVPGRGGQAHRGDSIPAAGLPGGRAGAALRSGPGADRGGPRVLPRRAWPGADGCPGAGRTDRERLAAADTRRSPATT